MSFQCTIYYVLVLLYNFIIKEMKNFNFVEKGLLPLDMLMNEEMLLLKGGIVDPSDDNNGCNCDCGNTTENNGCNCTCGN